MKKTSYIIGVEAENLAAQMLQEMGFVIIARRYKTKYGEIDIIAANPEFLVFCEVKERAQNAAESVDAAAQKRIINSAKIFLADNSHLATLQPRFDTIVNKQHLEHAFYEQE